MPSLMLRNLAPELIAKIRAFAREMGIPLPAGAARLLTLALDARDARRRGGLAKWADTTPEERQAMTATARAAALARHRDTQNPNSRTPDQDES